ncbi:MAG TPA: DUF3795 domain-containing protein [Bacilli bacterium]|nr:DUF3795 domain-containing protein [Bacilli bacterium]
MAKTRFFDEQLIAPCGMNCGLCIAFQFAKYDLNRFGFHRRYCPGCIPRGKNCTFMASHCELLKNGLVRFCYECDKFPCARLKRLDKRYRDKYAMSMIENLNRIKEYGIDSFLLDQEKRLKCPDCDEVKCCHTHSCLNCDPEFLTYKKRKR